MEKTVDILMLPTNTKTSVLKVYSDVNKVLYNLRYNAEKMMIIKNTNIFIYYLMRRLKKEIFVCHFQSN